MRIDDEYMTQIPADSQAAIAAENLLGTKYINIKKGRSPEHVKPEGEIASLDLTTIDDFVQQGNTALSAAQILLKKMDEIISAVEVGNGTIGKLLVDETLYRKVLAIADEAQKLMVTLNSDQGSLGKLLHDDKLYDDVRGTVGRINHLMDEIDQGQGTAGKLLKDPALYDDMRKTIADVRLLLAGVNKGEGTVGKLLKSDELHDQIKGTIAHLDALLEKSQQWAGHRGPTAEQSGAV